MRYTGGDGAHVVRDELLASEANKPTTRNSSQRCDLKRPALAALIGSLVTPCQDTDPESSNCGRPPRARSGSHDVFHGSLRVAQLPKRIFSRCDLYTSQPRWHDGPGASRQSACTSAQASNLREDISGYLRSALSSRNSIQRFKNGLPLRQVLGSDHKFQTR